MRQHGHGRLAPRNFTGFVALHVILNAHHLLRRLFYPAGLKLSIILDNFITMRHDCSVTKA